MKGGLASEEINMLTESVVKRMQKEGLGVKDEMYMEEKEVGKKRIVTALCPCAVSLL